MFNNPLIPQNNDASKEDPKEEINFKRPDFIVIDDRQEYPYGDQEKQFDPHADSRMASRSLQNTPFSFRFLCLLGVIFCFVFGSGLLISACLLTCIALLSLLQNKELNRVVKSLWKLAANTAVAAIGFMLGIISPTLGVGLLIVYFSLSTNHMTGKRLIKNLFKGFWS